MKKSSEAIGDSPAIRSYVRREHRMTPGQARALKTWWPVYGLDPETGCLDCSGECILEIGFGMGHSLLTLASQHPEKNFIGIEVYRPGIASLLSAVARQDIKNIRVFNGDAINILKQYIKHESLSKIQIFFPDPWPKNRQQKRRLIQPDFVQLLHKKLKPGGLLHLATDWQDYAEQMLAVISESPGFSNCAGAGQYLPHRNDRVMTKYEQRGLNLGHSVWDLLFEKN